LASGFYTTSQPDSPRLPTAPLPPATSPVIQNRMQESLVLFESVINSRWFLRTSVILFLNKIDVFKAKLPKTPLENYFPEYSGGPDINKAAKYILWRFTQTNRARLSVYPHLTQATDTSNVRTLSRSRRSIQTACPRRLTVTRPPSPSTDPARFRCRQGDDPSERPPRLGHPLSDDLLSACSRD